MPNDDHPPILAAKFSLWAPLVVVSIDMACMSSSMSDSAMLPVCVVSMGLYVLGVIYGVVALRGIRVHGPQGLLTRGVLGVCLNVVFLAATFLFAPAVVNVFCSTNRMGP